MNCPHCHGLGFDASGLRCFCQAARVAKIKRRIHDKTPLPASPSRNYLLPLAKWMLICIAVLLAAALTTGVLHA